MNPMQHSSISVPQVSHPSGWVSKSSQVHVFQNLMDWKNKPHCEEKQSSTSTCSITF